MRLEVLDRGHKLGVRLMFGVARHVARVQIPDVVKTLMYRPEYFGRAFSAVTHAVLRGPSPWGVGERELFAAYTARLNQCLF